MGRLCYPTQHPATVLVPRASGATKLSRCKEGMARVFAVMVQILLSITRVAVQVLSEPENYHGTGFLLGALVQCRGTNYLGARNLSWSRILVACRCACPDIYTITKLSWEQEQKQKP
jgi:hypothetical protein